MFRKTEIKKILEHLNMGISIHSIAVILSVSRNTISEIKNKCLEIDIPMDELISKSDDELYDIFYPSKFKNKSIKAPIDYSYIHEELKKVGVTLHLLWEEYVSECINEGTDPYSYSSFCLEYNKNSIKRGYTSHIEHKPGEAIEVDWSGPTMKFIDRDTGEMITAYLFVATLPYSQKTYVEATLSMNQDAWMNCNVNMFNYFGGTPAKIICDNLKTGVISHPTKGEIILNEEYLTLGEYYNVAILPTGVRKPKEKPSVEGSVGKIATKIIARLRNEIFYSLDGLNKGILKALEMFNTTPFQKRVGSREIVFNTIEKPLLKKLPSIPYEVCSWSYGHKVIVNSHVYYKKNYYSVPYEYLKQTVDLKANKNTLFIYYKGKIIASHELFSEIYKGKYRTVESHLPENKKIPKWTISKIITEAKDIGPNTFEVIDRLFKNVKVKEQAFNAILPLLRLSKSYSKSDFEAACKKALDTYSIPRYKQIYDILLNKKELKHESKINLRGSNYYRRGN